MSDERRLSSERIEQIKKAPPLTSDLVQHLRFERWEAASIQNLVQQKQVAIEDLCDHVAALESELASLRRQVEAKTGHIKWEFEDELPDDLGITEGMARASTVDIVRLYPYIEFGGARWYLEANWNEWAHRAARAAVGEEGK